MADIVKRAYTSRRPHGGVNINLEAALQRGHNQVHGEGQAEDIRARIAMREIGENSVMYGAASINRTWQSFRTLWPTLGAE